VPPSNSLLQGLGRADLLLPLADDELVLGWRDSEWTGVAPFLEEDVAFSSIAQNEIGHARALYELIARGEGGGGDVDELALGRAAEEYRCAPLVTAALPEWEDTIARRILYELADALRIDALTGSDDAEVAGVARKIQREERYHWAHAEMWLERLLGDDEGRARLEAAVGRLWGATLGLLEPPLRPALEAEAARRFPFPLRGEPVERAAAPPGFEPLWEEMTAVRRLVPHGQW
jgi:ring-1,2-phenylacetyl-CoA epoxidase subunit PaaC